MGSIQDAGKWCQNCTQSSIYLGRHIMLEEDIYFFFILSNVHQFCIEASLDEVTAIVLTAQERIVDLDPLSRRVGESKISCNAMT